MIKRILLATMLIFTIPATACEIRFADGLSEAEKQELKVLCEQKRAAAMKTTDTSDSAITQAVKGIDAETINKIQAISIAIVDAVTGIARGLGVEVNNFIQSPAGIVITTILIFYLIGSKIWGIFILIIIALIIRGLISRTRRINSTGTVTEVLTPVLWGLYTRTVRQVEYIPYKQWSHSDQSNYSTACWLGTAAMLVAIIIIGVNV